MRRRFCYADAEAMLDFESLSSGKPAVNKSDMKRVWGLTSELPQPENGCVSFDIRLIRERCSQGADVRAIHLVQWAVPPSYSMSGATSANPLGPALEAFCWSPA
jgi:hypothetical protein